MKNMPEGAYRLDANEIRVEDGGALKAKEIEPYLRQRPNKKILFGIRFHLGLYNAAPCDSCWIGKSMRTLGEAPVVFDPDMIAQSNKNIEQYLRTRGYYYATVKDSVIYNKHKAKVIYTVQPDTVVRIKSLYYDLGNDSLARIVRADSANTLLKAGEPLSIELMDKERARLVTLLHNKGFYSFSKSQIAFMADTIGLHREAQLEMTWTGYPENENDMPEHARYKVRNVSVYLDYDQLLDYSDTSYAHTYRSSLLFPEESDGAIMLYYHGSPALRRGVIMDATLIRPGDEYNETKVTRTYNNYTALNVFRVVNIQFKEVADTSAGHVVDCEIRLTPSSSQGFKVNLDASVSTNALFGISPTLSYFHKNLWRGGEYFNISFSGNIQFKFDDRSKQANEFSVAPSLSIPKFLFPWLYYGMRPYKPRSEFNAAYSHQYRSDYTRDAVSFGFGYNWRTTSTLSYQLNLINLNVVNVYNLSPSFYNSLTDPFLRDRYQNHFVLGAGWSLIYTDRQPEKRNNSVYLRWNLKTAGNLLSAFNGLMPRDSAGYKIGNTHYSQFAKTDINFSWYQYFTDNVMLAYRIYGGIGRGYGNSIAMPLEENYFSGGAYSLRGWQARTLGPGSALPDTAFSIPNQVGDIKLEANIEFRYRIIGPLEGAFFVDCGNIWSLNPNDSREGALFEFKEFYKQLALDAGLGLRLNFGFLVFRLDWGVRIHDPIAVWGGWVGPSEWFKYDNSTFNIGIGYPF